jgi:type 1 glutamine amidotransferase
MIFRFWLLIFLSGSLLGPTNIEAALVTNDQAPRVAFVIGENEYHTWETLPEFANRELVPRGFNCSFVSASTNVNDSAFSNIAAIKTADLLVLSVRRRALPTEMMNLLRAHLKAGKPLVGIRTASHAFAPKTVEPGQAAWPEFDVEILGCSYHGHYSNAPDKPVRIQVVSSTHPILAGIATNELTHTGSLYKIRPVAQGAVPLMTSQLDNSSEVHPVALVNTNDNRRVFYTSLGTREDFQLPYFRRLLLNAICFSMARPIPESKR